MPILLNPYFLILEALLLRIEVKSSQQGDVVGDLGVALFIETHSRLRFNPLRAFLKLLTSFPLERNRAWRRLQLQSELMNDQLELVTLLCRSHSL